MTLAERLAKGDSKGNRIRIPDIAIAQAKAAGLPLPVACVMLVLETGGGRNVFGHDNVDTGGTYVKGEEVTEAKYKAYRAWRGNGRLGRQQGVGPAQLTYHAFQDEADTLGGCWIPDINCNVGFRSLAANLKRNGSVRDTLSIYNAGKPAADSAKGAAYAAKGLAIYGEWVAICQGEPAPPKPPLPDPPRIAPEWLRLFVAWLRERVGRN